MQQASWGQNADDGRPYRGVKWLTVKQINFLYNLCKKEDAEGIDYFSEFSWVVDGYKAKLNKVAPNGCRQIIFININAQ